MMILKNKLILLLAISFLVVSCGEDTEVVELAKDIGSNEAELDAAFEDIDDMSSISVDVSQNNAGGRLEDEIDDDRICDGVVTFEGTKSEGVLTLDFGEGCEDRRGNIRTGKIIITYNGRYFETGSVTTITLEDYTINGLAVEGTRTVTNITANEVPTWNITLTGGKVTYEDGTTATREVNRVRVWERATLPQNDRVIITGSASGSTRRDVNYTSVITEELVFERSCRFGRRGKIPVSGKKVITTDNNVITINYGEGECDRSFTVSYGDETEEVNI